MNLHHLVQSKWKITEKTRFWREIRCNKLAWKRWMNYWRAVMVDFLMVAYVQFVIMLIELQNVVRQELKCLCDKTTTVVSKWTIPKALDVSLDIFIALDVNGQINYMEIHVCWTEVCVYCTHSTYILYRSIYNVCPKSHEIYFFAAPILVAACSNRLGEVGGPLSS